MASVPPPTPTPPATPVHEPVDGDGDVPPWPLWTLAAVLALGIGLWALGTILVAVVAKAAGSSISHPSSGINFLLNLTFDGSFVAAVVFFTVLQRRGRPADFGYRRVRPRLAIAVLLTGGVAYYVLTALYASIVSVHGPDKVPTNLGTVGEALFVCVVAPMAEELFFRGFVFGTLRRLRVVLAGREVGTFLAAVLTGILFGLVHTGSASPQYLVPLGFLGFVLCLVRWRTGSLYPCMALHSINNSLALGVEQWHWNAGEIAGLMLAALAVIAAVTGPLAGPPLRAASAA